nr:ATPase [Desulfobacterales bacterium]
MISVDLSLFIQIINFLFLIWALNVIVYRPIRQVLIERKGRIEGYREIIGDINDKIKEMEEEFIYKTNEAKAKGLKEKEALKDAGYLEEKSILEEVNRKNQAEMESARTQISEDIESARKRLQKEVEIFSASIVKKILGRSV